MSDYQQFLRNKLCLAESYGFEVEDAEISPILKPHQRDIVKWAVYGGHAGIFGNYILDYL